MPQIFLLPEQMSGSTFAIRGPEARHLIRVLRKKAGDQIRLFNGKGEAFLGTITRVDPKTPSAEGEIIEEYVPAASPLSLHLYQGLPKGSKFDYVIEKATELGAAAIIPFTSRKNPMAIPSEKVSDRVRRWERVAKAAAKQCGRGDLPSVEPPQPLEAFEARFRSGPTLLLSGNCENVSYRETIDNLDIASGILHVVVGPEGGLDPNEEEWLKKAGGKPVRLGSLTLRTETAGLVALSILKYRLNLFR